MLIGKSPGLKGSASRTLKTYGQDALIGLGLRLKVSGRGVTARIDWDAHIHFRDMHL